MKVELAYDGDDEENPIFQKTFEVPDGTTLPRVGESMLVDLDEDDGRNTIMEVADVMWIEDDFSSVGIAIYPHPDHHD